MRTRRRRRNPSIRSRLPPTNPHTTATIVTTCRLPPREQQDKAEDDLYGAERESTERPAPTRPSLDLERPEQAEASGQHRRGPQHVDEYSERDHILELLSE